MQDRPRFAEGWIRFPQQTRISASRLQNGMIQLQIHLAELQLGIIHRYIHRGLPCFQLPADALEGDQALLLSCHQLRQALLPLDIHRCKLLHLINDEQDIGIHHTRASLRTREVAVLQIENRQGTANLIPIVSVGNQRKTWEGRKN
uniref:Uncharacterized protein n=1 Tax=Zea mays TaxID=4577 RepID=C4IYQ2_MAIZE|nr:unknown [Zea mays]